MLLTVITLQLHWLIVLVNSNSNTGTQHTQRDTGKRLKKLDENLSCASHALGIENNIFVCKIIVCKIIVCKVIVCKIIVCQVWRREGFPTLPSLPPPALTSTVWDLTLGG